MLDSQYVKNSIEESQEKIYGKQHQQMQRVSRNTISQLQKICAELTSSNHALQEKVDSLEQYIDDMEQQKMPSSKMLPEIQQIKDKVNEYANALTEYHKRTKKMLTFNANTIRRLTEANSALQAQNKQLVKKNISIMQQYEPPIRYNIINEDLAQSVHVELEKTIERLAKELAHEKRQRIKLGEELRKTNDELSLVDQQIKVKNEKIYFLQMQAIENVRSISYNERNVSNSISGVSNNNQEPLCLTTLLQTQSISAAERIALAIKIVDLLSNRLNQDNFQPLSIDCIFVEDCHSIVSTNIIFKSPHAAENSSEDELANSLNYILDMVLRSSSEKESEQIGTHPKEQELFQTVMSLEQVHQNRNLRMLLDSLKIILVHVATIRGS